jgi:hypothetical protein
MLWLSLTSAYLALPFHADDLNPSENLVFATETTISGRLVPHREVSLAV